MLRDMRPDLTIGFFLHIPFPNEDIYLLEPHAEELLRGLLGSDVVGFHLDSYAYNFLNAVSMLTDALEASLLDDA